MLVYMSKKSDFKSILDKLDIDETDTKKVRKPKSFTRIKDNVVLKEDHSFMADLLMLPTTSKGFKYLLVVVDLATHEFDIEPLKTKQPKEVLAAMQKMFKRKYLSKPFILSTDGGNEFKGVFNKWLYDESILHKTAQPKRHTQMSMVEGLNRQLGRLFNGYMNRKEKETGEQYKNWDDVVSIVRDELNKHRKVTLPKDPIYAAPDLEKEPKYKVGDVVYRLLDAPKDALGRDQPTEKFRTGDVRWDIKNPRKIERVLIYNGKIPYRYTLEGLKSVSFTDQQLKPAKEKESKFEVKKIIDVRQRNKKREFLVWWKKYLKKESTWEPEAQLIEDGFKPEIETFLKENKKKPAKKPSAAPRRSARLAKK